MIPSLRSGKVVGSGLILAAAVVMGGCTSTDNTASAGSGTTHADTAAASLRTTLDSLLREHVELAAAATAAALGGRTDEFNAAASALDDNSVELSKAIGSVYGDDAGTAFLALWRKHIGFFVDYTTAVAKSDDAGKTQAVNNLVGYASDFGAFIESATKGGLKQAAVADLVKQHVVGLKGVVDAQAAKDWASAYKQERDCARFMDTIGNALADAITQQFPDKF